VGPCKPQDRMKRGLRLIVPACALVIFSCAAHQSGPGFVWMKDGNGLLLSENEKPVFYYRQTLKKANDTISCNNYLHPVYLPGGDTLTEEFPADHPYHRGIFWAWHQMYVNQQRLGDGWLAQDISQQVTGVTYTADSLAMLDLHVDWISPLWQHGKPFIHEHTTLVVHPQRDALRMIDAEIRLEARTQGVTLGGSEDEKGYGGFCIRMRLPEDLVFLSDSGRVTPQTLQVMAGTWMDISGSLGRNGKQEGVTILCHPSNPLYPAPWILRKETSMQNTVYPGREPVAIAMDHPVILRYRIVLHDGILDVEKCRELQAAFNRFSFYKP
jgi:hypothetical protein